MSDSKTPLRVIFLWHQHQPFYKDFDSGTYVLPWVRLHGIKDYLDMVKILDEFPQIKQTFNLVPSLLEQVQDYVDNDAVDGHMALTLKSAEGLTLNEKSDIVKTFFSANVGTMIRPYPRYYQIHEKVMLSGSDASKAAARLTTQELIDLAVWSNLAWIDPMFRSDPEIEYLYDKKHDFSEEDKAAIIAFQKKKLGEIIPAHKQAMENGQIEVSFSPYFHPILPLLIDTDLAKVALPRIQLPNHRYQHPEDAERQIAMSCDMYRNLFGRELRGMWPSEGSVADPLVPILLKHGIKWIATDEEVFQATINHPESTKRGMSLDRDASFRRPYILKREEGELGIVFRDHGLSDKLGFVYSGWDPEKAADDFVKSLRRIRSGLKKSEAERCVLPVILDGENAWEYYKSDGADFLRALYTKISDDPTIRTITVSEAFENREHAGELPYLFAGSWIDHNFRVWIGHEEDNKAWDLLSAARDALSEYERNNPDADPETLRRAWKRIFIAEGSDWCWWYGDDHSSGQDDVFDRLFRSHLAAVYRLIDLSPPEDLLKPIRGRRGISGIEQPMGLITPVVDGLVTNFYEWHESGLFDCLKAGSAMHRAINVLHSYNFGFDDDNIYFRLDLFTRAEDDAAEEFEFRILLRTVKDYMLSISSDGVVMKSKKTPAADYEQIEFNGQLGRMKIVEVSVPRKDIEFDKEFNAELAIEVIRKGELVERWPSYDTVNTTMPTEDESAFWQV